ncbi:trehalose synthase [Elusimicrobium simillimum]|uniref:glycosyltransferase n=1 Tax=Elusimicrobium simillimum TaxID=3143438 RepID=UPI003C6FF3A6
MKIDNYKDYASPQEIEYIKMLGKKLGGRSSNVLSTASVGGGLAEILNNVLPFLEDFDFNLRRINVAFDKEFLSVARKINEALSDPAFDITQADLDKFFSYNTMVRDAVKEPCDLLFVYDHPPISAVEKKNYSKAIWRCYLDVSHPDPLVWDAVKYYIEQYDAAAFSFPSFSQDLSIPKYSIMPSIDPLADKNREIEESYIDGVFAKYGIPRTKPVILQVGRFDALKDPIGVLEVFKEIKKEYDCTLVLAGGKAADDPGAVTDFQVVSMAASQVPGAHVILMDYNELEVNALQTGADIIIQKGLRETFGLTLTEAMWKKKAVVAAETGALPLQIMEEHSGLTSVSNASCVAQVKRLLKDPQLRYTLGVNAHKHVKENFLITRHVRDLFIMFAQVLGISI